MSIPLRIQRIMDYKHLSTRAFEDVVGVSNGYIRKVKSVSADVCVQILDAFPEISAEWLMRGVGEMIIVNEAPKYKSDNENSLNTNDGETLNKMLDMIQHKDDVIAEKDARIRMLTDKLLGL